MKPPFPVDHPLLFIAIFVFVWIVTGFLTAAISGWSELARVYRGDEIPPDATVWRGRGARFRRGARYNNCLTVASSPSGVYFAVIFFIRIGHPPLFIPWSDIHTHPVKGWVFEYISFTFRHASTPILLRRTLAEEVLRAGGQKMALPASQSNTASDSVKRRLNSGVSR